MVIVVLSNFQFVQARKNYLAILLPTETNIQLKLEVIKKLDISDLLFVCKDCIKNMAALPQGAFAAYKLKHVNEKTMAVARRSANDEKSSRFKNKQSQELGPVKYNGKLMNSIWGMYNRNSPHNFKKNNGENDQALLQQQYAVAKIPHLYEESSKSFDNFFNVVHPNTPNWDQIWKLNEKH